MRKDQTFSEGGRIPLRPLFLLYSHDKLLQIVEYHYKISRVEEKKAM